MSPRIKSILGAALLAAAGAVASQVLPEGPQREAVLVALATIVGWLGLRQPGQLP